MAGLFLPLLKTTSMRASVAFERGTTEMVFALRLIQKKCREQNRGVYTMLVDLTTAFDTESMTGLWTIQKKQGCLVKFLTMIIQLYKEPAWPEQARQWPLTTFPHCEQRETRPVNFSVYEVSLKMTWGPPRTGTSRQLPPSHLHERAPQDNYHPPTISIGQTEPSQSNRLPTW